MQRLFAAALVGAILLPPVASARIVIHNDTPVVSSLADFGGKCDGVTDDAAAFAAAIAWLKTASNRQVRLPVGVCMTSTTVQLGDGRQQSTTLTAPASGSSITVAAIAGIQAGDAIAIRRDDGTLFATTVSGTPSGSTVSLSAAYSGGAAASGNPVFTGKVSSYNGGGFKGYGSGGNAAEWPGGGVSVSTIKATSSFPAAGSTTLTATASVGATSLTVASITNISLGTAIGITLDNGRIWWTWPTETPTGTAVKIANEVPSTATSGNALTIAHSPLLRVAGPMVAPVIEGVLLDANSRAAIGFEAIHPYKGSFDGGGGIKTLNYTAIGQYIHSAEFYVGTAVGVNDNRFELHAFGPTNAKTIGVWLRGSAPNGVGFSRNHFIGGTYTMGGNDVTAAGLRAEFLDNNTFLKPYSSNTAPGTLGAGLYLQPSRNTLIFPNENTYLGSAFVGGVTCGTATGGTVGHEHFPGYSTYDGEPLPTCASTSGYMVSGQPFGGLAPAEQYTGNKITKTATQQLSIAPGSATDSTGRAIIKSSNLACNINLAAAPGLNSVDAGAVAPNTWYAIFTTGFWVEGERSCIATATTSPVVPTPTLPAGSVHTYYAYVGRLKTDGSSQIRGDTILPRGQFYIDGNGVYTPGASGFRPREVRFLACGGGAGGGSGGRQVSGTAVSGGTGGAGGGCHDATYAPDLLPATLSVTVGAGGAAATAPGTDNTAGTSGNSGSPTFFGDNATNAYAYGGAGCAGDGGRLNATAATGGSGAGAVNSSGSFTLCSAGAAGTPGVAMLGGVAGSSAGTVPATSNVPGVGNAGGSATTAASAAGGSTASRFACPGGGAGGGVTAAPAAINGGNGGWATDGGTIGGVGGTSGTPAGGAGLGSTVAIAYLPGKGGGGGYGNHAGNSGSGGAGGQCAGGGGGGSTLNGSTAGNGGAGGAGFAFVWER